jgi:hypothetical protein
VSQANDRRQQYISELTNDLLTPLARHAREQLAEVMEEIKGVMVQPYVPELEETLSRADILVHDSARTTLLSKGTGVRGALLVALLGYLARYSRRSLILAVEEPESFLHPRAQQELRSDLSALAKRSDVTLLVTSHSPFLLDRSPSTTLTSLSKDTAGRTVIGEQISGDSPHAPVVSALFGETITPSVLDIVDRPATGTKGVLFVEGYTDKLYLETAARVAERMDLLDGLEIRAGDGAHKAAVEAILLRQMVGRELPIGAIFDHDELGKSAASLLKEKFNWRGSHVFTFRKWRQLQPATIPVEAEDMFPAEFLERFLQKHPGSFLAEKMQFSDGTFHYGLTQDGKKEFISYVSAKMRRAHATKFVDVLEEFRKRLRID